MPTTATHTTAEMSIADKLTALYDLQKIDSKIDAIRVIKGELPIEVKDLEDEIEGLQTRIRKGEEDMKTLEQEIARQKMLSKDAENHILKYEKHQEQVKNAREFEALAKEIEMQKLDIELSNKKQREARTRIADREANLEGTRIRLVERQKECAAKRVELDRIIKETEAEEAEITVKSEAQRELIEERLLKAYDKIRLSFRNGLAVVKIDRNACGGCYSHVPAQTQLEIALRKKIIVCENCGRILVDELLVDPEVEAAAE